MTLENIKNYLSNKKFKLMLTLSMFFIDRVNKKDYKELIRYVKDITDKDAPSPLFGDIRDSITELVKEGVVVANKANKASYRLKNEKACADDLLLNIAVKYVTTDSVITVISDDVYHIMTRSSINVVKNN